ncbi:MAG: hypothetical protein KF895_02940 [Parvibaculum sp.]|nr:hypothetical protein [Parvibaculum sp.]
MSRYARGEKAWGECARSGQRMLLKNMVEDGHIPGLMVHPDWWEPKHPQERVISVTDPQALHRPAPELSKPPGEGEAADPLEFD